MKQYLLFGWFKEGKGHGFQDLAGNYDKLDDAIEIATHWPYYQIIDVKTGDIVEEYVEWMEKKELDKTKRYLIPIKHSI